MHIYRKKLCPKCTEMVRKTDASYMKEYREKKKREAEHIKKFGVDVG